MVRAGRYPDSGIFGFHGLSGALTPHPRVLRLSGYLCSLPDQAPTVSCYGGLNHGSPSLHHRFG